MRGLVAWVGVLASLAVMADAERDHGGWRLCIGPAVVGGVRSRVGVDAGRMVRMSGFASSIRRWDGTVRGPTSAEAHAQGSGEANGGRRVFDDGAFYDPEDSAVAAGNDRGYSWYTRLHDPQGLDPDGRRGFIERTAYIDDRESVSTQLSDGGRTDDSSDWLTGPRVEVSRELYRSGDERPWGVDLGVAFAYYFRRNIWRTSGTAATATAEGAHREGYYEWWNDSHDEARYILDNYRGAQFDGSMWGTGSFDEPGMELASDAWRMRNVVTRSESWSDTYRLAYDGRGRYREYSIEMIARPWWEPWDWLRVFASLGAEVSRREFKWTMSVRGTDGSGCRETGRAEDWRACGLLGGGLSAQWRSFSLMGEALWRFGGESLKVRGRSVRGEIEHGDWGFRLAVGYEF